MTVDKVKKVKVFRVLVPEVWYQEYIVEATSKKEAAEKILDSDLNLTTGDFEYSHTLQDKKKWNFTDEGEKEECDE
jgi:hypothetical protein